MSTQNVKVSATAPSVDIKHPDGSMTTVSVEPNGQISRGITFSADDGATVTVMSNGAGGVSEVRSYSGGRLYVEERHPDGTRTVSDERTQSDGSRVIVTEKTFPDGHAEVSTDREQTLPDGGTFSEHHDADGSSAVSTVHPDGRWESTETLADGSTKSGAGSNTPDGWINRYVDVDGTETVTVNSYDTATGRYTTTTTLPDGRIETETEQTLTYPDGRTVYEHTDAAGTRTTRIERSDGSIDSAIVHADGTTETSQRVMYPDGRVLNETVNADGTRESTLSVPRPDGSIETTLNDVEGNTVRTVLTPDGSVDRQVHHGDGSTEHTGVGPDGYGSTTLTEADGTRMVLDQYPDPALEVDPTSTPEDSEPPVLHDTDPAGIDDLTHVPEPSDAREPLLYETADSFAVEDVATGYDGDLETLAPVHEPEVVDHELEIADVSTEVETPGAYDSTANASYYPEEQTTTYEPATTYEPVSAAADGAVSEPVTEVAVE